MRGGVGKRGKRWYYYFEDINDDGSRKKVEKVGGRHPTRGRSCFTKKFYQILTKQDNTF